MSPAAIQSDFNPPTSPRPVSNASKSSTGKGTSFTIETFENKDFIVKDFVEDLTESSVPANRKSGPTASQALDPKPLIRAFETTLSRIGNLSEELEARENSLLAAVQEAEAQHSQNVESLGKKLEQTAVSFERLDTSLRDSSGDDGFSSGNAALRIGETLEELNRQRQRAQDAKYLIQCWIEVTERGELSSLEEVRGVGGPDGKVRCAHIARQLLKINDRLGVDKPPLVNGNRLASTAGDGLERQTTSTKHQFTKEKIEKYLESLEQALLKQFDEFYRRQNFQGMKECAGALRDFNEGASVMALFVNQHQFFIDRSQLITDEISMDGDTLERLADPDADAPGIEHGLQSLVDEVRLVVQEESFIMKRAFPYYEEILMRFVQRVFQQSIQQRLELFLNQANSISSLAFLRSLQAARSYISSLVEDLKSHGLTEHPEPASIQTAAMLDQQLEDLFVPYLVGSSYIEREKRNLEELYSSLLLKFTIYHSRRKKGPTNYLANLGQRGKELLSSAKDAYTERLDAADLPALQKARLLRIAGLKDTDNEKKGDIEVTEEDGTLRLPYAKRMLKWLAEGVGRSLELSGGTETPKDVQALLKILLSNMSEIYLENSLEAATDAAVLQQSAKTEPDISYLPPLRTAIVILHLLQVSIQTVLLPLAGPNLTVQRAMSNAVKMAFAGLEEKISSILHRTLDVVLAWATKVLATQKKTDFRPKDDTAMDELFALQTPTCHSLSTFLTKVYSRASAALEEPSIGYFSTEVAAGVRALLLEHFRKFNVNAAGGLLVSKDVSKYVETMRGWPLGSPVEAGLSNLTEVANLFVIGPEAIRERLRAAANASGLEPTMQELRAYVLKREDSGTVAIQAVLNSL